MKQLLSVLILTTVLFSCHEEANIQFKDPEKPWVFWYWMEASVSKAGITADLEAMKEIGIGGAYLMPIKGPANPPLFEPVVEQLTPIWWEMVRHAMSEAKRLGLQIGMHASDGFALAGGPWITPELSMQKVTWSDTAIVGGQFIETKLSKPPHNEHYYQDIATFAIPITELPKSSSELKPKVTSSTGSGAEFLTEPDNKVQFRCEEDCWFQYSFDHKFTCRSVQVITKGNNYQAQRLLITVSQDGNTFEPVYQLEPARHGWQDTDEEYTYAIPETSARHFRFEWKKEGTEPGAEDLDAAKWSPRLKITGLELSNQAKIHQYEAKNGSVWRIAPITTEAQLPAKDVIKPKLAIDISEQVDEDGTLKWEAPDGSWKIIRMGHTSTGHTNYTGGGGLGLECDKFNPEAIDIQFEGWFGTILDSLGTDLTRDVLRYFHVDSWECGSQNWSPVFRDEFIKRRGYDPIQYLPVIAGIPLESAEFSEKYLHDIRQTISELTADNFYQIMAKRAHAEGMSFSAESIAPTMMSDGLRHHGIVDLPMGEFWLKSPTHDKPNDMMDAISGAHIYGKQIIQAEGFTQLRMAWDEHPGMLKTLLDRNYALGINKLFFHVFMHNPWMDRQPGMSLGGVGLYFQRDQTWWKPGRAFVEYITRSQKLLQEGWPVASIAVYTGDGLPSRSVLPDRLAETIPGIFGSERVTSEAIRLKNELQPQRVIPKGVKHSANMADPEDWLDPLNGYKFDSFNKDALLCLAKNKDGKVFFANNASYDLIVLPQPRKMAPNPEYFSAETLRKITVLAKDGATVLIGKRPIRTPGLDSLDSALNQLAELIWGGEFTKTMSANGSVLMEKGLGEGKVIQTPYHPATFAELGLEKDFKAVTSNGKRVDQLDWTHRRSEKRDIYFITNQSDKTQTFDASFLVTGKKPKFYDAVGDLYSNVNQWSISHGRTTLPIRLSATESIFVLFEEKTDLQHFNQGKNWEEFAEIAEIRGPWSVDFLDKQQVVSGVIMFDSLIDWTNSDSPEIQFYSGIARYETSFEFEGESDQVYFSPGELNNIAEVELNGEDCGVIWTQDGKLDVSNHLKPGVNNLTIEVTNTWKNRMIGDHGAGSEPKRTWTNAPYRLDGDSLAPAGLVGPVKLLKVIE